MFNPLKGLGELNELRKQAQKIQDELKQIVINTEKGRWEIEMSADMKVRSIKMNGEEVRDLVDGMNETLEKIQKKAAAKMQEMGGGLQGLLGK